METLLALETNKQMQAFRGEILDKQLQGLLQSSHLLILQATKRALGPKFLSAYHRARDNTEIPAMFLAILLAHMGASKALGKKLTQMVFEHAWLGEIDATLDNVDDERKIPMPQNYYMTSMRGREVMKFPLIRTIDPEGFEKLWAERDRNIFFLLKAAKLTTNLPRGWVRRYMEDEEIEDELDADDDQEWGLGEGEEWQENDQRDPEEKAKGPTHNNCSPNCPIVSSYKAYMKRCESEDEGEDF